MPYKNPEDRPKQKNPPVGSKEFEGRMERQRARRKYDAKGIDRTGKDIDHKKMISKGGKNSDGTRLVSPSKNRSRNGKVKK
jgi:hypothetical protein